MGDNLASSTLALRLIIHASFLLLCGALRENEEEMENSRSFFLLSFLLGRRWLFSPAIKDTLGVYRRRHGKKEVAVSNRANNRRAESLDRCFG